MRLPPACASRSEASIRRRSVTRSSVARQSAMMLKLSTNQRSDDCACVKAAAAIIKPPNETLPEK
ncbi:hypothetical protein D9M68_812320 [compost metagenome]